MKIESLTDETIIVELSEEDMKNLNITYEEMDYSRVETKRVIWTILSRAWTPRAGFLLKQCATRQAAACCSFPLSRTRKAYAAQSVI